MTKTRLFGLAFLIAFTSTALLCIAGGHPLVFLPVAYGFFDFLIFAILIATLCFGLVFLNLPLLRYIKKHLTITSSDRSFYIIGTLIILQVLTLLLGYLESSILSKGTADAFYYYRGVGNSLIYILTGNITAFVVSNLYAKEQEKQQKLSMTKFEFEK